MNMRTVMILVAVVIVVGAVLYFYNSQRSEKPLDDSALLERGSYLMQSIVACGNCHTPKTDKGVELPGMELAGGLPIVEPHLSVLSPNSPDFLIRLPMLYGREVNPRSTGASG